MPPRLRLPRTHQLRLHSSSNSGNGRHIEKTQPILASRDYASLAYTPAASPSAIIDPPQILHHNSTQPPSYKPAEFRKTQLHRQYTSLLRSSPLVLLFQHNNLKAVEWAGLRRELATALRKVDTELAASNPDTSATSVADAAKMHTFQTGIFASALKIVEFYKPEEHGIPSLSKQAYGIAKQKNAKLRTGLEPLLSGPLMAVAFPAVSPQHLKATLEILAPNETFPAPKRKALPSLYDPPVQAGLQKLMLLGARVDGDVFDMDGARWVGGIKGGIGGLRSQLVYMLSSVGAGITNTLEGAAKSLWVTMESRRQDMEGPKEEEKKEEEKKE